MAAVLLRDRRRGWPKRREGLRRRRRRCRRWAGRVWRWRWLAVAMCLHNAVKGRMQVSIVHTDRETRAVPLRKRPVIVVEAAPMDGRIRCDGPLTMVVVSVPRRSGRPRIELCRILDNDIWVCVAKSINRRARCADHAASVEPRLRPHRRAERRREDGTNHVDLELVRLGVEAEGRRPRSHVGD